MMDPPQPALAAAPDVVMELESDTLSTSSSSNLAPSSSADPPLATSTSTSVPKESLIKKRHLQFNQPRLTAQRSVGSELLQPLLRKIDEQQRNNNIKGTIVAGDSFLSKKRKLEDRMEFEADEIEAAGNKVGHEPDNDNDVEMSSDTDASEFSSKSANTVHFNVLYAKPTTKKHKTWDGDGTLTIIQNGKEMILRDETGQILSSAYNFKLPDGFGEGSEISIGGKLIQVENEITKRGNQASSTKVLSKMPQPKQQYGAHNRSKPNETLEDTSNKVTRSQQAKSNDDEPTLQSSNIENQVNTSNLTIKYNVLYAKPTTKKHKTWDGDGILTVVNGGQEMTLVDEDGQIITSSFNFKLPEGFGEGTQFQLGGKIIEVQEKINTNPTRNFRSMDNTNVNSLSASSSFKQVNPRNHEVSNNNRRNFTTPQLNSDEGSGEPGSNTIRYSVLYTTASTGKFKQWEGDGILAIIDNGAQVTLTDESDQILTSVSNFTQPVGFGEGSKCQIGDKFVEVSRKLTST